MAPSVAVIVPSVGRSADLVRCLEALAASRPAAPEIVLVAQGGEVGREARAVADRVIDLPQRVGFARAVNVGARGTSAEFLATVNDDCIVDASWLEALTAALLKSPCTAAAQGANRSLDDPSVADGLGLAWNRRWQAVQLGRGHPLPAPELGDREVFGVSATAALFRRVAIESAAVSPDDLFDERLYSYYEDVDLASRLRAAGLRAALVSGARASHAGSASEAALPSSRFVFIYGNRYLVLARMLGRSFFGRLPALWLRDLLDIAKRPALAGAVARGWWRASRLLAGFARMGPPSVGLSELRRLGSESWDRVG